VSRWFGICFVLAVLLAGNTAWAMTAAPMCGPDAASVIAPIPSLPIVDAGEIKPLHMCVTLSIAESPLQRDEARRALSDSTPDRALASTPSWAPPLPSRRPIARYLRVALPPGFTEPIYRPPRA
jgi:hypothetical protein